MRQTSLKLGALLVALFLLATLFAPMLTTYPLGDMFLSEQLAPPSLLHWLGQNHHGQDLWTLIVYGSRVSLVIAMATVFISASLGTILGLCAGYFGGWIDHIISRLIEIVMTFPGILLAIAMAAVLGASKTNVVIALSISGWVPFARLVRGQTLTLREREFILAARVLGASHFRILSRHILTNLWSLLIVQSTFSLSSAILSESSLSFLGLGVPSGVPSWGKAMADGTRYLLVAPHLAIFPGVAILLFVWAFNLVGDGLRDAYQDSK